MTRAELKAQIDAIEESYEFFLAFAAQGATGEAAERADGQVRDSLTKMDGALSIIPTGFRELLVKDLSDTRRAEIRTALLAYCKLDTLAMVRLAKYLAD